MNDPLTREVIGAAIEVHDQLGSGFLESVYANALAIELEQRGIAYRKEAKIDVHYKGQVVGEFRADLFVENTLIVELKAVNKLVKAHEVQTVNYLTATNIDVGLLFNFGTKSLEFRRKHRIYKDTKQDPPAPDSPAPGFQ